jgi:glutamate synthase (NADPH) small chain
MGKATGFLTYSRKTVPERPLAERICDWRPLQLHLPDAILQEQAARCMDCGIPFCHHGTILKGMTSGCPVNNLIPEWNDLVYRGLWREAYERLRQTNNFPEFTGLVCPAPCEASCTLGIHDPPVTIKSLEYAIIERAFGEGWVTVGRPARRTGIKVAVIGSGPAGLACAEELNIRGHRVTVFERADRPGGLLMYGIPTMKLDKQIVQRRIDLMAAAGVVFQTGAEVGGDYPVEQLRREFDAVVLCIGATRPRDLPVAGRELEGIHFAVPFLKANTQRVLDARPEDGQFISARGQDVIVIGGGDTGTDCVATAVRHGCRSLAQFEILPCPPAGRAPDNPWPQWPLIYRVDYGQAEAAAVFGADPRHYCLMTRRFIGDNQGRLEALETVQVTWQASGNGQARPLPQEIPGSERIWPAQLVLLALGFLGPEETLLNQLGVSRDGRGNVHCGSDDYSTNVPGIFAAGDARRGQSLVVWAIQEGRAAAQSCHRALISQPDIGFRHR